MMNETKRFSELQVVRFHEVCGNGVICSFSSTCIGETGAALRKADICVFCKLKGPKCISCLVYTGHDTLVNLVTAI